MSPSGFRIFANCLMEPGYDMQHDEFQIGVDFWCNALRWRCTDIGSRTIAAICLDRVQAVSSGPHRRSVRQLDRAAADSEGWFNGPPYAVQEHVFDEDSIVDCSSEPDEPITIVMKDSSNPVLLPPQTTAKIWSAVRRGEAKDAEDYVVRKLEQYLDRCDEQDKTAKQDLAEGEKD
jgi:hypothetical protein